MTDYPILRDILILIGLSLVTVYFLRQLRVPAIVGFIVTGVLIGPGALGLIDDRHSIELMAEIGVSLLLFTVGLKFSIRELSQMRVLVLVAGGLQVVLTTAVTTAVLSAAGVDMRQAVFYGFLVSLSSTAIVIKLLEEQGQSHSLFGRLSIGVLLFQDLAVVPLLLLTMLLGGEETGGWYGAALAIVKSLTFIVGLLAFTQFVFPWLIEKIARIRSSELFMLTTVFVALGAAFIGSLFGFSLPLGAFLAGVVISGSVYTQQILAEIKPLRDILNGLFFVSVGMFVTPAIWLDEPLFSLGAPLLVIFAKAGVVGLIAIAFGFGSRIAVASGLGLAQIGEFSFVLALVGVGNGLLDGDAYSRFLTIAVPTMALTPLAMRLAPAIAERAPAVRGMEGVLSGSKRFSLRRFWQPGFIESGEIKEQAEQEKLRDHVIIVGYGINGQNVARVLGQIEVPYLILELNPFTVRSLHAKGERIYYGDATRPEVLRHAGIAKARVLVAAIADPVMSRQIVCIARELNPDLKIVVRTRLVSEMQDLFHMGADEVVPEEFETSLQLAGVIMATYGIPERTVEEEKMLIRRGHYSMLLSPEKTTSKEQKISSLLSASELSEIRIQPGMAALRRSIQELDLRNKTGATILAVERAGRIITNPLPDLRLEEQDAVFLVGNPGEIKSALDLLTKMTAPE